MHQSTLAYPVDPANGSGMTRTQQTAWIVGAIVAVGLILAIILWPQPDFGSMGPFEKCEYSKYYKDLGGDPVACKGEIGRRNLMGERLPEAFRNF